MVNTAVKASASKNHLSYLLTGDGTVVGPTIANATILADMTNQGPLFNAWNATYANQAAMRTALMGGGAACNMSLIMMVTVADTTAQINQPSVDVDTDAITATKAEINITMSDTTGTIGMLTLSHWQSMTE